MLDRYLTPDEIRMVREDGFNEYGLRYTLDELNEVSPLGKTIEELAGYVDAVTYVHVRKDRRDVLWGQLQDPPDGRTIPVSVTGLGNLAYTALHSTDPEIRGRARRIFDRIVHR